MAYSLSNTGTKNFCKRTVLVQLIVEDVVMFFIGTQCMLFLVCIKVQHLSLHNQQTSKIIQIVNLMTTTWF